MENGHGVLVTGASGFIGSALLAELYRREIPATGVSRQLREYSSHGAVAVDSGIQWRLGPELGPDADWSECLAGHDCVVHCAARQSLRSQSAHAQSAHSHSAHSQSAHAQSAHSQSAHAQSARSQTASDADHAFRFSNAEGTRRLAEQAAAAGVQRFILLSSLKVHGESTAPDAAFVANDPLQPEDPYAQSKWAAEQALRAVAQKTGMECVILRPPLVYGPGARGNVRRLVELVARGVPLPFGAIQNRRSLLGIDNLVDLIIRCLEHPAASGQAFLASDGEDLSTPELIHGIGTAMGKRPALFNVPPAILYWGARILHREAEAQRLIGSLRADIGPTMAALGWKPPYSVTEGLERMLVEHSSFLNSKRPHQTVTTRED